jgi:hypothetical protein
MTLRRTAASLPPGGGPALRFNPAFADVWFAGSGHSYKELADLDGAGKPLPRFAIPAE